MKYIVFVCLVLITYLALHFIYSSAVLKDKTYSTVQAGCFSYNLEEGRYVCR